jgi:hypothetical protein
MTQIKSLNLNQLLINTENYRFEPVASQKEAIDLMLEDQKEKLYNLASDILEAGWNPLDKIVVVPSQHGKSKYNVLEGNRRITSLKLVVNPDLIEGLNFGLLKKKFKKLHEKYKDQIPQKVECSIFDDPKIAERWIAMKHGYGKDGTITATWESIQKQRFQAQTEGIQSNALQVINLLKKSSDVPVTVKEKLIGIASTNINRLISDPNVRHHLGLELNNGIIQSKLDPKEVIKGLTYLIEKISEPGFTVKKIYTRDDRQDFIKSFPKKSLPDQNKIHAKAWAFSGVQTPRANSDNTIKSRPIPKNRKSLIPKNFILKIEKQKVNEIYHELIKIDPDNYAHATSVLFRVFIELSVDTYLESNGLVKNSAAKSGFDLKQKINLVAEHLQNKKHADAAICHGIKHAVKDSNGILGVDTLHAYIHNNRFSPTPDILRTMWDNVADFILILWQNIK